MTTDEGMDTATGTGRRGVVVGALTGVVLLIAVAGLAINLTSPPTAGQWRVSQVAYLCDALWFTGTGGFLVLRVPGNVTGRAMLVVGVAATSSNCVQGLLNAHRHGTRLSGGLLSWAAWLDNWTWLLMFGGLFALLLHFPDGRQPGRFWRWLELSVYAALGVALLICVSLRVSIDYPDVKPAVSFAPVARLPKRVLFTAVNGVLLGWYFIAMICLVIALLVRWRRSQGARRAQLKWLLAAAAVVVGLIASFTLIDVVSQSKAADTGFSDLASQLAIWLIPIAIGVAVTRHGLFEIDRLVSRTVSYAVVVALLVGAYVAVVAGVSALVPDRYGAVPVVLATLAVSALFLPLRRRVIAVVDRRFNRSRYDAAVVVADFADRVRGRAGTGTTGEDLVAATRQVLQPAHATVWLAPRVPARRGEA